MHREEVLDRLFNLKRKGIKYGLENMLRAIRMAGDGAPSIRIAGTNGKGSTAAFLEAILRAHGLKTGLFTSPHLIDYTERFRINGTPVQWAELSRAIDRAQSLGADLTFFETSTVAAHILFREQNVDVAIFEAGLGGRLDSTTAVPARITAITSIGLDHASLLTAWPENVAWEKAGAIAANGMAVIGMLDKRLFQVIRAVARAKGAAVSALGEEFRAEQDQNGNVIWHMDGETVHTPLPLKGSHHVSNMAVALTAARLHLNEPLDQAVLRGLNISWQGRFQKIGHILLDGAHNPQALQTLVDTIRDEGLHVSRIITGMMEDKDVRSSIRILSSLGAPMIAVSPDGTRGMNPSQLADIIKENNMPVLNMTIEEALEPPDQGMVLVTGSFYLVGRILAMLKGTQVDSLTDPAHSGTIES